MKELIKNIIFGLILGVVFYVLPVLISFPIIWVSIGLFFLKVEANKVEIEIELEDILLSIFLGPLVLILIHENTVTELLNYNIVEKVLKTVAKLLGLKLENDE